jgi:glycine cleavage system H protein
MKVLDNLHYTKTHEWVEFTEDNQAKIGLTDFAQSKMGSLVFANLPMEGDDLTVGEALGDVESVKAVSDVISPISGVVTAVNEELLDTPETINEDPYGAWLVMVSDISEKEELLDAKEYVEYCSKEE